MARARNLLGNRAWAGLCEGFVEEMTFGHRGLYPSAIAAWQAQFVDHVSPPEVGDWAYFTADATNNWNGHVGIVSALSDLGSDFYRFISATEAGVEEMAISEWLRLTGQGLLGFVRPPEQA